MKKILLIQTAFLGDVVLATALLEKLHFHFPEAELDMVVRKGNEPLLTGHPFLHEVLVWDKKQSKYTGLLALLRKIRGRKYDLVVNTQRFFSTGLLTAFSGAKRTVGFTKNPLAFLFSKSFPHEFGDRQKTIHEIERNQSLVAELADNQVFRPKLYPPENLPPKFFPAGKYLTISPGSVWYTKQWPAGKWVKFMDRVGEGHKVFLMGGPGEIGLCEKIKTATSHPNVEVKAGRLSLLESAALMQKAVMNFTNDSAPAHMATAVDAPVTTIFCSTVPAFGFTPLSDDSASLETDENLRCRPCGLHGKKACPEGHFRCSNIEVVKLLDRINKLP